MKERRVEQRVLDRVGRAIEDFELIVPGDRILVAVSGGKDSWGLLWALLKKQAASPFHFDLVAYHLDQGQPGHDTKPIAAHLEALGVPHEIGFQDTYKRVLELTEPGKVYCSVCAHFRRAILYKAATKHGCNKVALGHHRDDLIETLLLNILFSGQIKSMPPKLRADDRAHEVIRPLCYVPEEEMIELAKLKEFPVVPCSLCGSQDAERKYIKNLLAELSEHSRHVKGNLLAALGNVNLTHLMDKRYNPHLQRGRREGLEALGEEPRRTLLKILEPGVAD
ncbi:MAG: tRNA 2-thiocytidine(32) synthetase TtcA [Deltaproteobacteria bacterium]|nr:tRNA 2-thiocytidine(32) synthetase TtcA [Deltaproteobacteria bacterium]